MRKSHVKQIKSKAFEELFYEQKLDENILLILIGSIPTRCLQRNQLFQVIGAQKPEQATTVLLSQLHNYCVTIKRPFNGPSCLKNSSTWLSRVSPRFTKQPNASLTDFGVARKFSKEIRRVEVCLPFVIAFVLLSNNIFMNECCAVE